MNDKRTLIIPIVIIAVGTGWLLTALDIAPGIDWIWTLGLAVCGVATIAALGWNKVTLVVGLFFLAASGLSLLRQTGRLRLDVEVPVLVILTGVLLLVARSPAVPMPHWIVPDDRSGSGRS